jgi:predicted GNAT family acetyltransferase
MLTCVCLPLAELGLNTPLRHLIRDELTKPGSDFHKAVDTKTEGYIAVVWCNENPVGWARTERWYDGNGIQYDTLEAFVRPERRQQGIAAFAAAGLFSATLRDGCTVAVFSAPMLLVARRAGFWPVLFERDDRGWWRQA